MVISHNYQQKATQDISHMVVGTGGFIKNAPSYKGKNVIINAVLYMAEDFYIMSDCEANVFIPEITVKDGDITYPRCPMISDQGSSPIVRREHLKIARDLNPELTLVYINTPASMKAEADAAYNASYALTVIDEIASKKKGRGKIALVGDYNVNEWIKAKAHEKYPEFEVVSVPDNVFCPTHLRINPVEFIGKHKELSEKYGAANVELSVHAEVEEMIRDYAFKNNGFFGGTGSIVRNITESSRPHHIVGTVEGCVDRARGMCSKDIWSPGVVCGNMAYTSPDKVERAKELISNGGPVAEIHCNNRDLPYYDVKILRPELVEASEVNGSTFQKIPAVQMFMGKEIAEGAKKALSVLL